MQPLKPEQKRSALENSPQSEPRDIEEYERLLSLRFAEDPDQRPAAAPDDGVDDPRLKREARIKELHQKLFGSVAVQRSR